MRFDTILASSEQGVGTLIFNRSDAMNALNLRMMAEVKQVISEWDLDASIRAIVITGSDRAFASGADIKEMQDVSYLDALQENYLNDWCCIAECRTPTIAAVAGYALGGGCEIAMMCDFIMAAENAQFGQPEIRLGTIPGLGGTQRLTRLVGAAKAMEMCMTGRMMNATEAERAGLVSRVVPVADLLPDAQKTALLISGFSAPAVTLAREAVNAAENTSLSQGLEIERRFFYSLFGTEDQKEGMSAFVEKRKATFSR
ncbi:MAG: enoyl-CoA hydratase-related protein [Granulosicoccus sp.]